MGCQALLPQAAEEFAKKTKSAERSNHEIKGSSEKNPHDPRVYLIDAAVGLMGNEF